MRREGPLLLQERAKGTAIGSEILEHGLARRKARFPERRQRHAVVEIERLGQFPRAAGGQVLGVNEAVAREAADGVANLQRSEGRAENGKGVGTADEPSALLDLQESVEHEVDEVAPVRGVTERGAVEVRRRGQGEKELRRLPLHGLDVQRERRFGDEEPVEIGIAFELQKRLACLVVEVAEPPQLDVWAGAEAKRVEGRVHGLGERSRLPVLISVRETRGCGHFLLQLILQLRDRVADECLFLLLFWRRRGSPATTGWVCAILARLV